MALGRSKTTVLAGILGGAILSSFVAMPAHADVDIDPPTITGSTSPAPNANGWNNSDVTVSFVCDDGAGSGIDTCTGDTVLSTDGADQEVTGTALDLAGNSADATVSNIDIDKTAPDTVTGTMSRPPDHASGYYTGPVTINFSGTDATSGIDTCSSYTYAWPDNADAFALGTCTDLASNSKLGVKSFKFDMENPAARVDSNGPNTPFGPTGLVVNGAAITGRAVDGASGVVRVGILFTPVPFGTVVARDATMASPGSTSTTWSVPTTGLLPGAYRVQALAVDGVGHLSQVSPAVGYVITGP